MNFEDWRPSATVEVLKKRAQLISVIRQFFTARGYLEVETPIMAHFGVSDCYVNTIPALFRGLTHHLLPSPEYHMKRLLASGSGPIFQISKVFRDDELGRWHNPEFTMLDWYQLDWDHHALIAEMDEFLQHILGCSALIKCSYRDAFFDATGIDPILADWRQLRDCAVHFDLGGVFDEGEQNRDSYLFLLMSHVVEPKLAQEHAPVALVDFPASQAALAKLTPEGLAARFEIYYQGVELANGFYELTDKTEQAARFEADLNTRQQLGFSPAPLDGYFLAALEHGLPCCSGVALGVDRLIALALGQTSLASCLAFDYSKA